MRAIYIHQIFTLLILPIFHFTHNSHPLLLLQKMPFVLPLSFSKICFCVEKTSGQLVQKFRLRVPYLIVSFFYIISSFLQILPYYNQSIICPLSTKKAHGLQFTVLCAFTLFYGYSIFTDYANCITLASISLNSSIDNIGTHSAISSNSI